MHWWWMSLIHSLMANFATRFWPAWTLKIYLQLQLSDPRLHSLWQNYTHQVSSPRCSFSTHLQNKWSFVYNSIKQHYSQMICAVVFSVKYLNTQTGMVFLRFPKMSYKLLWSALPFITSIDTRWKKIPCFLNCLHVGGKKIIIMYFRFKMWNTLHEMYIQIPFYTSKICKIAHFVINTFVTPLHCPLIQFNRP